MSLKFKLNLPISCKEKKPARSITHVRVKDVGFLTS